MGHSFAGDGVLDDDGVTAVDRRANYEAFKAVEKFFTATITETHAKVLALTEEIDHMKAEGFEYADIFAQQEVRRVMQEQIAELKRQRKTARSRLVF